MLSLSLSRILAISLVAVTGCSFVAVKAPPVPLPDPSTPDVFCTTSRAAPVIDTMGAVASSAAAIGFAGTAIASSSDEDTDSYFTDFMWIGAVAAAALATPYWIATVRGYRRTGQCRRFRAERQKWLQTHQSQ